MKNTHAHKLTIGTSMAAALLLASAGMLLQSCATAALTAAIISEQQKQAMVTWEGTVLDITGAAIEGVAVHISSDRQPENKQDSSEDLTDAEGRFSIRFPYYEHAMYSVQLVYGEQSSSPVFYQNIFINKQDEKKLSFSFNVNRPEEVFEWTGVLGEGVDAGFTRVNKALVLLSLEGLDNTRRYWVETGDGGVFQFPYDWNQQGSYTIEVVKGGLLRTINDHNYKGTDVDVPGQTFTDDSPLLTPMSTIASGAHHNVLRIAPDANEAEMSKTYKGLVKFSGNNAPAQNALVLLCLGGDEETPDPENVRLAARGNERYFWGITDQDGRFEIEYDIDDAVRQVEIVIDGRVLEAVANLQAVNELSRQEFSVDLSTQQVEDDKPVLESELTGTLTDHRAMPVTGLQVFLTRSLDEVSTTYQGTTNAQGKYSIDYEWLAGASYQLSFIHYDRLYEENLPELHGNEDHSMKLDIPRFSWSGRITDENQLPWAGARLTIKATDQGSEVLNVNGTTDNVGNYSIEFDWDSEYEYSLSVMLPGSESVASSISVGKRDPEDQTSNIEVKLPEKFHWTGVISNLSSMPIVDATVLLTATQGGSNVLTESVETDANGAYDIEFSWLADYSYSISITLPGASDPVSVVSIGQIPASDRANDFTLDDTP